MSSNRILPVTGIDIRGVLKHSMEETIQMFDVVALVENLPTEKLYRGNVGAVVEVYAPDAFEVEFVDGNGRTYGLTTLARHQLLVLHHAPVLVS